VQETVSTVVPTGCSTVIDADVNATSVMISVQFGLGQPGAPGIGLTGAEVVTLNDTLPFLISDAGIPCTPVSVTLRDCAPQVDSLRRDWCRSPSGSLWQSR
jgi:hypothetical protein